jgi:hypothetical protein
MTPLELSKSYMLIDGLTGELVCRYKALSIALRDCEKKNAALLPVYRYYVKRPNGSKITA